jgi:hypothetical protein
MTHSGIELSKIPARFSSSRIPSCIAYIWFRLSSAFITPKEKGQEVTPDRMQFCIDPDLSLRNCEARSQAVKLPLGGSIRRQMGAKCQGKLFSLFCWSA